MLVSETSMPRIEGCFSLTKLPESLFERTPTCLAEFDVSVLSQGLGEWNSGSSFTSREVACRCGHDSFDAYGAKDVKVVGFFKKREDVVIHPPIYLECTACSNRELLFDESTHGWNGQYPDGCTAPQHSNSLVCVLENTKVAVNYSYQSIESYQDLIEDGVPNPEDYFDTFTIYVKLAESAYEPLASYECA